MNEKVIHYLNIPREKVDKASKTWIRWLITDKDGAPTFAMRLFEIEPRGHIPAHKHPWEHEIFVLEGKGRIRIGEKTFNVEEGYVIFIPPNIEHEYWNTGDDILKFICVIPLIGKQ